MLYIEKFAKSWKKLESEYPNHQLTLHLRSNRSLDSQLADVVNDNGFFDDMFCENRYKKDKRKLRATIFESTGLSEDEFQNFLGAFHFDLKQPSWKRLEEQIIAELLDHKIGISNVAVFNELKKLVEIHAIEIADPITPSILDLIFKETQTRYLLPQSFFVDKDLFVEPTTLKEQLNKHIAEADGEYIVVTGPPGSGKSTALTQFCDDIEENNSDEFMVVRYYCFIHVNDNHQRMRLEAKSLRVNLLSELQLQFPNVLDNRRFDYDENHFYKSIEEVARYCGNKQKKLLILLDGLDHVERDDELRDTVIAALPAKVPANVLFLIGTQELHQWTPVALKEGRKERHISMPLFSWEETKTYVVDLCGLSLDEETVIQIFEKSAGLPLYLAEAPQSDESRKQECNE